MGQLATAAPHAGAGGALTAPSPLVWGLRARPPEHQRWPPRRRTWVRAPLQQPHELLRLASARAIETSVPAGQHLPARRLGLRPAGRAPLMQETSHSAPAGPSLARTRRSRALPARAREMQKGMGLPSGGSQIDFG